jgi:hypothetical protein
VETITMKSSRAILVSLLLMSGFPVDSRRGSLMAAAPAPGEDAGDYAIGLEVSNADGRSTWRYTIDKTNADTKDLGHFILDLNTCGGQGPTMANVVSATVDGVDWSDQLAASEGKTGCEVASPNVVKFDNLPAADSHVVEFTLDDVHPPMDTSAWLKRGRSCTRKAVLGPGCRGYVRTSAMEGDASLVGKLYGDINTYMRRFGFDYTEHPNCTGGYGGDINGVHGDVDVEPDLGRHAFRFFIHIDPVIDGDRCSSSTVDRQRNEMKSITNNSTWAKVQGNWDEWQILEWKFRLPAGLQPTSNFFHIHQLKAQDGPNNGAPTITITPRASGSTGTNKRIQIIHSVDGASTGKGTVVDNVPLSDFEDEWVQVREEMHYTHDGYYSIRIARIRDGKVLIDFTDDHIDMWRIGSSYIRSKFGLYRSLAGGRLDRVPVGQSPLLKNELIWITDFRVYEKNPNPSPGVPHD